MVLEFSRITIIMQENNIKIMAFFGIFAIIRDNNHLHHNFLYTLSSSCKYVTTSDRYLKNNRFAEIMLLKSKL